MTLVYNKFYRWRWRQLCGKEKKVHAKTFFFSRLIILLFSIWPISIHQLPAPTWPASSTLLISDAATRVQSTAINDSRQAMVDGMEFVMSNLQLPTFQALLWSKFCHLVTAFPAPKAKASITEEHKKKLIKKSYRKPGHCWVVIQNYILLGPSIPEKLFCSKTRGKERKSFKLQQMTYFWRGGEENTESAFTHHLPRDNQFL